MGDALSESSRRERFERLRQEWLVALEAYLKHPSDDATDEALEGLSVTSARLCTEDDGEFLFLEAAMAAAMFGAMSQGDAESWATFLYHVIGLDDHAWLDRFRRLSPFAQCALVAVESDRRGLQARVTGEAHAFFSGLREDADTLVETRSFPIESGSPDKTVRLLAISPMLLR